MRTTVISKQPEVKRSSHTCQVKTYVIHTRSSTSSHLRFKILTYKANGPLHIQDALILATPRKNWGFIHVMSHLGVPRLPSLLSSSNLVNDQHRSSRQQGCCIQLEALEPCRMGLRDTQNRIHLA